MSSSIDATQPITGSPTTASVRANFLAAKSEIEALQTGKANLAAPALTGNATAVNLTVSGTLNATGTIQINSAAITATAAEINKLDGVTATTAEINHLVGVTSGIQAQLDGKQVSGSYAAASHTHAAADVVSGTFADARIAASNVTQHQAALALAASQTTSGTFANARISQSSVTQHQAAINAGKVDGYDVSVVSSLPGSPDANTIYLVTG